LPSSAREGYCEALTWDVLLKLSLGFLGFALKNTHKNTVSKKHLLKGKTHQLIPHT
jgi:hypothetical protein